MSQVRFTLVSDSDGLDDDAPTSSTSLNSSISSSASTSSAHKPSKSSLSSKSSASSSSTSSSSSNSLSSSSVSVNMSSNIVSSNNNSNYNSNDLSRTHVQNMREQLLRGSDMTAPDSHQDADDDIKPLGFPSLLVVPRMWQICLFVVLCIVFALSVTVLRSSLESCCGASPLVIVQYLSIPVISLIFTYCHIWLALWMTFYPTTFVGVCQIPKTNVGLPGWMGIIPFKAEKMARMSVQLMTTKLLDVKDVFARLDPTRVAKELSPFLKDILKDTLEQVAMIHNPDVWHILPKKIKDELIEQAHEDSPEIIANMMHEVKDRITEVFDIEDMVVRSLMRDKELLNSIFIQCGYDELVFIRNSGATMGAIFGLIQMVIWFFYPQSWQVPVFGLIVGLLTNWLALKMIFQPVNPVYICGGRIKIQGLFLQRQAEVSAQYGRTIAKHILNAKNILAAIIAGPTTDRLFSIVSQHVVSAVDSFSGSVGRTAVSIALGVDVYSSLKRDFAGRIVASLPDALAHLEVYADEALDMENTLREKMAGLPFLDFERLLHPVFEEDEWKLVLMGGALGVVIGICQIFILTF